MFAFLVLIVSCQFKEIYEIEKVYQFLPYFDKLYDKFTDLKEKKMMKNLETEGNTGGYEKIIEKEYEVTKNEYRSI